MYQLIPKSNYVLPRERDEGEGAITLAANTTENGTQHSKGAEMLFFSESYW